MIVKYKFLNTEGTYEAIFAIIETERMNVNKYQQN